MISVGIAASYMISKFVEVKAKKAQLAKLNSSYAQMQAGTLQKQRDYNETDTDMQAALDEATAKLHLQRPDSNQVIYVEVERPDKTDATVESAEGVGIAIQSFFEGIFDGVVHYFSVE